MGLLRTAEDHLLDFLFPIENAMVELERGLFRSIAKMQAL
jgi:hypothetical protein